MDIRTLIVGLVCTGHFGSARIVSDHKMNKGGRTNSNTLWGRVTKEYRVRFRLASYRNAKAKKLGVPPEEVVITPPAWSEHVSTFLIRHVHSGIEYFACLPESFDNRTYYVDNRPATLEEMEIIREYTPNKGEKPEYFTVRLDDVKSIKAEGQLIEA